MVNKWLYFSHAYQKLISHIQPVVTRECLVCHCAHESHLAICSYCLKYIAISLPHCVTCGRSLHADSQQLRQCGHCQSHPPHYTKLVSPMIYKEITADMIKKLKFGRQTDIAQTLAWLFLQLSPQHLIEPLPQALVPVPIHWRRALKRGFNQTELIGAELSRLTDIPLISDKIKRVKYHKPQSRLTGQARHTNVRANFQVAQPLEMNHVAVVDDVFTTGATVNELALVLEQAGVRRIDVWTICHT